MTSILTDEERSFFGLVQKATAANPFSDERRDLNLKMAGRYGQKDPQANLAEALREVGVRIQTLEEQKRSSIRNYGKEDRQLVKSAFLFDAFHQFIPAFDQLIMDQLEAGARNLKVGFASQALGLLQSHGFSSSDARRYFELFFQLRRAFFFIQQGLVGHSPCMVKLRENLWNNVFTHNINLYDDHLWNRMEDFSTMILGPTGAGKGTAAAAIGRSAYIPFDLETLSFIENFTTAFISINLSQYSETLIESELFGHKKGAFTGAIENYQGVFDRCSPYGAILLDEIGEVSQPIQIKLLQVLQERYFVPVGDHKSRRFSGRVIAATNRSLAHIRRHEILRDDFFYRLCSDIILVPGLSQRIAEDSEELNAQLSHTVGRIVGRPSPELVQQTHHQIIHQLGREYPWPGNVRELEQCVRRLLVNNRYTPSHSPLAHTWDQRLKQGISEGTLDAQTLMAGYCHVLYQRHRTYEAVAQQTCMDRRTAKKYIQMAQQHLDRKAPHTQTVE